MDSADEIIALRHRVAELEELLGIWHKPHRVTGFSPMEWQLIGLLAARGAMPRDYAYRALYGNRPDCDQPVSTRIIDVVIARLRKKLKTRSITLRTEFNVGYFVDADDQNKLNVLFDT